MCLSAREHLPEEERERVDVAAEERGPVRQHVALDHLRRHVQPRANLRYDKSTTIRFRVYDYDLQRASSLISALLTQLICLCDMCDVRSVPETGHRTLRAFGVHITFLAPANCELAAAASAASGPSQERANYMIRELQENRNGERERESKRRGGTD